MSKKHRQSREAKKSSKRTEVAAKPEFEIDTDNVSTIAEAPQAAPTIPEAEVAVESQQPVTSVSATPAIPQANVPEVPVESQQADAVTTEAAGSETAPKTTRSDVAKANIKEGLKQHALAGRPTKAQLILVFGKAGYLLTWPKRTERFGIRPEDFQAALAKSVPAVPLAPVTHPAVEKPREKARNWYSRLVVRFLSSVPWPRLKDPVNSRPYSMGSAFLIC